MNERILRSVGRLSLLLVVGLLVVACGSTPEPTAVPPTQPPPEPTAAEPTPTPEPPTEPPPEPTATPQPTPQPKPDPATGQQLWVQKPCAGCHGLDARGVIGPKLAGTTLSFEQVLSRVRKGKMPMPAFTEGEISDMELRHIYAWLRSLAP